MTMVANNLLYQHLSTYARREMELEQSPEGQMELACKILRTNDFMRYMTGGPVNAAETFVNTITDRLRGRGLDAAGRPMAAHPDFRHRVKAAFKAVGLEWHRYHSRLRHSKCAGVGLFRLSDMAEEDRRRYGDITDSDLYQWWQGFGPHAYREALPTVNALQHKIALSLSRHGHRNVEHVAWALVGDTVLQVAQYVYNVITDSVHDFLPQCSLHYIRTEMYPDFSLCRLCDVYRYALRLLAPDAAREEQTLDPDEQKNINMSIHQLKDTWINRTVAFDAALKATQDFGEDIFKSRGFHQKALREIAEMRQMAEDMKL